MKTLQVPNINAGYGGTGINSSVVNATTVITLRTGLAAAEGGNVTVNISLCRATGHDFLDIGTGGYNTSNYPNVVLGQSHNQRPAKRS